jgi:UDP-N-acetylglucosamine acyltransferase
MSTGTEDAGEVTRVGERCFFMANSHVGHDCNVGNEVTFANGAVLGGHVQLGNNVFVGGNTAVHQFVRVGEGAMLGGMSGITRDVIPFGFAFGPRADLVGLNVVGLKRRGHSRADMHRLRQAYQILFQGPGTFTDRSKAFEAEFAADPLIGKIVAFIREGGSRALMRPAAGGLAESQAAP